MRDIDSIGGDERFKDMIWQILLLHEKKQQDYGTDEDPFANVRAASDFGVPAWIGVAIRMNDKMRRLMTMARRGTLSNESTLDSFMDLSVYGAIAAVLVEEEEMHGRVNMVRGASGPSLGSAPHGMEDGKIHVSAQEGEC